MNLTTKTDNPLVQQFMDKHGITDLIYKPTAEYYRDKMEFLSAEERVRLARMNPVIMAEYYLRPFNKQWNTDAEDYQYLLLQSVIRSPKSVTHINVESGKSTWVSEVLPLWYLMRDRNLRLAIVSRTARQAERFGRRLMHNIKNNRRIKEDFGDYLTPDPEKWTQSEMFIIRDEDRQTKDPSAQFLGITGAIQGARIDILIGDDILDLSNSQTEITRQKVKDDFLESFSSRVVDNGKIALVGTLQSRLDLLCELSDNSEYDYVHMKAVNEDTRQTISRRWNYDRLMAKKREIGSVKFMKLFQNDRNAMTGTMLKPEWLNYYGRGENSAYPVTLPPLEHMTSIVISIDPAIADKDYKEKMENNNLDYFAMCVMGYHSQSKRLFIIENFKDRLSLQQQLDKITEYHERYRPMKIGIETVAYQKALSQSAWSMDGLPPIVELKTTGASGSKESRIEAMGVHFENGRVWVSPDNHNFLDEYLHYPDVPHDDVLDSVELALRMIGPMSKKQHGKGVSDLVKNMRLA